MKDQSKTKQYLLKEISQLQQRLKELEVSQTEQLRALEELQRSEMKFRTLYDSTSDAVILMDRKIFDCNDAALKIFGCTTREELRGTHPADLSPPVQPCGTQSRILGDRHITLALKNGMHRFEWVHRRIDTGETFPADILLNRMVIDGRMVLQAVIRDITQRKQMEEVLRKEIEFNSTLIESSPAFFVAINADRTVRHMNDAMLRALGYTLEDLKNKDYMVLVPESDRESLSRIFSTLITKGQPTFNENRVLTKDGKSILVEWHGRAIKKPDGSPNYFFGVGTDITERKRVEDVLRESEDRFRTVANATPTALMLYQDDHWTFVNRAAEALTGYSSKELLGMNFWDIVHPDYRAFARERGRKRQKEEGPVVRYELKIITKSGAERWADVTAASAIIWGRPAGVISLADITVRKAAEEKLVESEARFRSYFELPLVGIAITSPEKGWVQINDRLCDMLGYSREELVHMTWSELTHPDDLAGDIEQFNRVLAGHIDTYSMDKRFIRKDGVIIWTSLCVGCVRKRTREVDYMVALFQDITVRQETEEALKESEEKFRLLIEQSVDPILLIHDNIFIGCNEAAVRLIQCSSKENLIGLNPANISPERQPDGCLSSEKSREVMKQAFRVGNNSFEWVHRTAGGEDFWVDVSLTVIPIHGKQILFTVWRDINKRKKVEQALLHAHEELELRVHERTQALEEAYQKLLQETEQKNALEDELRQAHKMEAIGTLAGGIAHDFNNILASIIGFTEMAIEDVPDRPSVGKNLKNVMTSATRARELVKQILAFSRKTNHARALIAVTPIVVETVKLLRASIPATIHMSLSTNATSDTVLATSAEVQGIVMNLATNALLAMEDRKGSLEIVVSDIELEPDPSSLDGELRAYLQIMVRDTGVGIAPEVLKRIFDPFFTTREVGKGSGMGLAIVYGTVKGLGGMITVESEPAKGSTFRVFLPKAKGNEKEEMKPVRIPRGDERVLFVDDEQLLVDWGRETLEKLGYTVSAVDDAQRALDIFAADPALFDIVITDQAMPQMSGLELSIGILRIRADIPIILCTGYSETVSRDTSKEMGIRKFLMKPLTRQELASTVRNVLNGERD